MFGYLILSAIVYVIYANRSNIKTGYTLYKGYKNMIDPENKISHFSTIKSIVSMFWRPQLPQPYSQPPPEPFNKKYLKISYKYKDKDYFYLLKIPKGIPPIQKIEDENGVDIQDTITPYLGPNLDCHGQSVMPMDFGYSKVVVTTIFDSVVTFEENDKICL